ALYLQFPQHADLFDIGGFRLGSRISRNHNPLLGRYPGADGMKTGFTCSAGFNIVASPTRGNRRLITAVLGAPSTAVRTAMDTARAVFEPIAVYIGRAPGWSGPVAQARPANTPIGTPSPLTAYAPDAKSPVLDGSAAPIAASAADALPMNRGAAPIVPRKPTK